MLVLSRKVNEVIYVGEDITITVVDIDRGRVRLGIEAPRHLNVARAELGRPMCSQCHGKGCPVCVKPHGAD